TARDARMVGREPPRLVLGRSVEPSEVVGGGLLIFDLRAAGRLSAYPTAARPAAAPPPPPPTTPAPRIWRTRRSHSAAQAGASAPGAGGSWRHRPEGRADASRRRRRSCRPPRPRRSGRPPPPRGRRGRPSGRAWRR